MKCIHTSNRKNSCWIWIAVDRNAGEFIDCVLGTREAKTGKKVWNKGNKLSAGKIMTDYWKAYTNFLPEYNHIQSKAETYIVEGYNSFFRHFLARMRRKTKCYSKCKIMLEYSVRLLMAKWNNRLSILD